MTPRIVYEINGQQMSAPLDKDEVTIGRSAGNDVVIHHQSISRRHAKLQRRGQEWRVVDLGSSNGTRVNHLPHAKTILRAGDKIYLGKFAITFTDGATPGASLIGEPSGPLEPQTVFQSTVDFSSLASAVPDAFHLQKLLTMVTAASQTILVSPSLDETFKSILELIFEHLPVERGFIMVREGEGEELETRCVHHKLGSREGGDEIRFSRTIAERVIRDRVAVLTADALSDDRFAGGASIMELGIRSAMAAPLWRGEKVDGLIYVDTPFQIKAFDKFDLDLLSALGNQVAVAIEQSRLQSTVLEQQIVRRRLARYHSPAVVERIASSSPSAEVLVAEEREVTVLFADVVEFTPRCEGLEPREVAELLNRYFGEMTDIVFGHEGTLDKFIGDCLMAVFGAPLASSDHAQRAADAALDMRRSLQLLNEPLDADARLQFRVGMHTGRVVAGDIGSPRRRDYTVLGAAVNLAARIESDVAKPGQIIISETTQKAIGESFDTRFAGEHQPRGTNRKIRCFELLGRAGDPTRPIRLGRRSAIHPSPGGGT